MEVKMKKSGRIKKTIVIGILAFAMAVGCLKDAGVTYAARKEMDASQDPLTDGLCMQAKSAILMELESGTVLYEKNADEMLRPASVTKIMTLLLIFEAIERGEISLEDTVVVSFHL